MSENEPTVELLPEQQRRTIALINARKLLESRPAAFGGTILSVDRSIFDLVTLATWILDGRDPTAADENPDRESDLMWGRRKGYVEGVKASMTVVSVGGGTDDLNKLLGEDDQMPSFTLPDQSALADTEVLPTYPEDALPR